MGSSAGVALFVLEHREEEEDEGGRKEGKREGKKRLVGDEQTVHPAAGSIQHPP